MIRKLSLAEWFLTYQLKYVDRNYSHIAGMAEVDLSRILDHFGGDPLKVPLTSILIKACSIWQRENPVINRQMFKTLLGPRLYSCESNSVNIPALLKADGDPYLSVLCIKNADQKTISSIKDEIANYSTTDPKTLPIGSRLIGKPNNIINRWRLRIIHFVVNTFPTIQNKLQIGTISLSSLLTSNQEGTDVTLMGKGPGAVSLTICGFDSKTKMMTIGISWDHATAQGYEINLAVQNFCRILQGDKHDVFNELLA
ncbi:MAG: hypothetical protein COA99_01975 [Moraxellaceae bacterium]|nr:MAG: hypothetical protein COA99_01975 [Moraxellaceae bacterium]